jgi:hypothetical protein
MTEERQEGKKGKGSEEKRGKGEVVEGFKTMIFH